MEVLGSWGDAHLAEGSHVAEGSVLDDLVALAGVAQLGVALHRLGGQADPCALAAGGVRRVEVVVALEDHQLALGLGDVCGEGFQDVAEGHLHLGLQLGSCCQSRGQLDFEELPAARENMTVICVENICILPQNWQMNSHHSITVGDVQR